MWVVLSPPPPHSTSRQPHPTSKSRNTSTTLPKTGSRLLRPAIPKWWMASSHCRMDQVSASHWTKRTFASIHDSRYFSICSPKTGTVARRNAQQPRSSKRKKIETRVNLSLKSTRKEGVSGVFPDTFSLLLFASVGGSYEWISECAPLTNEIFSGII